jgi:hypothetical protein
MREGLEDYMQPFKEIVLRHIASLGPGEWDRLRELSRNRGHCVDAGFTLPASATAEDVVHAAVSEDSICVDEVLVPAFKRRAVELDRIEGQPVYYVSGTGMYVWGKSPSTGFSLSFWATYPAYPPGW